MPKKYPKSAHKVPQKVKQIELTELIFLYLVDQDHWGHYPIQALVSPLLLLSPVTESFRHDVDDPHMLMLALEKKVIELTLDMAVFNFGSLNSSKLSIFSKKYKNNFQLW